MMMGHVVMFLVVLTPMLLIMTLMHVMMMVVGVHVEPGRVWSKRSGETSGFEETFQTALPRVGNYFEHRDDKNSETLSAESMCPYA